VWTLHTHTHTIDGGMLQFRDMDVYAHARGLLVLCCGNLRWADLVHMESLKGKVKSKGKVAPVPN